MFFSVSCAIVLIESIAMNNKVIGFICILVFVCVLKLSVSLLFPDFRLVLRPADFLLQLHRCNFVC